MESGTASLPFGRWRHLIGLAFLSTTIFLWTASNFMASTIFADNTYSKPYFVAYLNTSFFMIPLIPALFRETCARREKLRGWSGRLPTRFRRQYAAIKQDDEEQESHGISYAEVPDRFRESGLPRASSPDLLLGEPVDQSQIFTARSLRSFPSADPPLTFTETARLSLEFCVLWFTANYFAGACLQFTTVASATILNSTCSVFTLIIGVLARVEHFTIPKALGVVASLAGVVLISLFDLSGQSIDEDHRGDFPEKSTKEIAIGDAMAIIAAIFYGLYAVLMKKRVTDESRVNMQLFFGLVGAFNVLLLWPGMVILHFTGVERAELPPTGRVTMIILCNAAASLISDISWVYAVLFTSPIVVTVGLSITIPLSLIGQILLNNQTAGLWYWIGALVIVLSFVLVNHEGKKDEGVSLATNSRLESNARSHDGFD